jgi:hypothetical protein
MAKKKAAAEAGAPCLCMGMGPKLTEMLQCRSQAAAGHLQNARIEFLKGVRTLLDERIEQLSAGRKKKGTAVPVE